jgi:hypothetical protein
LDASGAENWAALVSIAIDNYQPSTYENTGALLKPIPSNSRATAMTVSSESDQRAQSTKERIKRGARKLFALHGIEAVTVRDIVRESKTKKPRRSTITSDQRRN